MLAFRFFVAIESSVVAVISRLTAAVRAAAVRLCLWRSPHDHAGPLFASPHLHFLQMSPSNKAREEELTGEPRTHRRPLWTIFSLMSIPLAAVPPPPHTHTSRSAVEAHPQKPPGCHHTSSSRHKEGRYAFNHPLSPLRFFLAVKLTKAVTRIHVVSE